MFSGKEANYPTQWALNPTAYQDMDSSQVDWATLAQQWIAMKEATATLVAPPPPSIKADIEQGEAPMDVENDTGLDLPLGPTTEPDQQWNNNTNSWGGNNWNQWGKYISLLFQFRALIKLHIYVYIPYVASIILCLLTLDPNPNTTLCGHILIFKVLKPTKKQYRLGLATR